MSWPPNETVDDAFQNALDTCDFTHPTHQRCRDLMQEAIEALNRKDLITADAKSREADDLEGEARVAGDEQRFGERNWARVRYAIVAEMARIR